MAASLNLEMNSVIPGIITYDINTAIDTTHYEVDQSPIDSFILNCKEINRLFINPMPNVLGNLVILGYVSAVESYFRALFRRLILIDEKSRVACEKRQIAYGAVLLSTDHSLLPEALFEDISIAGKKNIIESCRNFLNLPIQDSELPAGGKDVLNQFNEICELRHCIIHRFGKFGSKTALTLGLNTNRLHIEKPINCDFNTLQQFISVCQNVTRIFNNHISEKIFQRLVKENNKKITDSMWTWDYKQDKENFNNYFSIFYSKQEPPSTKLNIYTAYRKYLTYYQTL